MLLINFVIGIIGVILGSFINVLVLRTHSGESWVRGRSHCPHCHKTLEWYELIPLISYLVQKGHCRHCHKSISVQYPLVELTTGLLFMGITWQLAPNTTLGWLTTVFWLVISVLLVALAVYDARWQQLPDTFMIPALIITLVYLVILQFGFSVDVLIPRLIAAVVASGIIWLLWLLSRGRWIGDGDIWLIGLMGLLLNAQQFVLALFLSIDLAAIVAVGLLIAGRKKRGDHIPLGTFLIIGIYLSFFLSRGILAWYGHLVGLNL